MCFLNKNKYMKKIFLNLFVICYLLFVISMPVLAQDEIPSAIVIDGKPANINQVIANMAKLVLGLVGVLALVMFIIGGITWMTSGGNAEQVKKGKGTLIWATIGLIICFMAYSLVSFVITKFIGVSSGSQSTTDPDYACVQLRGQCIDPCVGQCNGQCKQGYCGGGTSRQCCVPSQ
jgi:hypothetical protein